MRVIDFLQMRVIDQIYSGSHHSHVINCKSNNCLLQKLSLTNCDNDPDDRPTLMSVLLGTSCVVSVTKCPLSAAQNMSWGGGWGYSAPYHHSDRHRHYHFCYCYQLRWELCYHGSQNCSRPLSVPFLFRTSRISQPIKQARHIFFSQKPQWQCHKMQLN